MRILVASPLGHVVAGPFETAFEDSTVEVASTHEEYVASVSGRVRFDVVAADLIWNRPEMEWTFDGLDAIDVLRAANRLAPVLLACQGHSMEQDHLEEARMRPEVSGVISKSEGLMPLINAVRTLALGRTMPMAPPSRSKPPLYELFVGQRGHTAGRLAGAIASGAASDNASLARVAKVSPNTANKVANTYLGPIMSRRGEHDEMLPLTQAAVYRWCGLHARYITSWCRRHGHSDVLAPLPG